MLFKEPAVVGVYQCTEFEGLEELDESAADRFAVVCSVIHGPHP